MTTPYLTLDNVSYVLPDGRTLFSNLSAQLDIRRSALVGRNGVGKSILAQLLAGLRQPSSGQCLRQGRIHYLAQQRNFPPDVTLAQLLGVEDRLAALKRIAAGSIETDDFEIVGSDWDLPQRLQQQLERLELGHLSLDMPAQTVSGGEVMQVALLGATLAEADCLILDEPSNHLDAQARRRLAQQLADWQGALLLISHDRQLLAMVERIYELSPAGLKSYGGNYQHYHQQKQDQLEQANDKLQHLQQQRRKENRAMQQQQERQQKRQAKAGRDDHNQAKILLGGRKQNSEKTLGKIQKQQQQRKEQLDSDIANASSHLGQQLPVHVHLDAQPANGSRRQLLTMEELVLPMAAPLQPLNLTLRAGQRLAVMGSNGAGKSTLLKVMAGEMASSAGEMKQCCRLGYLDQQASQLNPNQPLLAQLPTGQGKTQGQLRTWLAQLGLDAQKLAIPTGQLSGGERIKAALALLLYGGELPELLLLDEPSNHLDLSSLQALEAMLGQYQGALVVVSHDQTFLDRLQLTDTLLLNPPVWQLAPC